MPNEGLLHTPPMCGNSLSHLLTRTIAAIELNGLEGEQTRLGPVSQLPDGSALFICGDGFNEKTVKIRSNGKIYFVFRADLGMN